MVKRVFLIAAILIFLSGCSVQTNERAKLKDLDYTIVEEGKAPEELQAILEEKRTEPFKLTYEEENCLYLCVGYGEQRTNGYSIAVNRSFAVTHVRL